MALPWTYLCPFAAVILLQICMLLPDGTKTSIWRGTTAPQGTLKSPCQHTGPVSFKSFGPLTPRRNRFKRKGVKAEERAASTAGAQSQIVKVGQTDRPRDPYGTLKAMRMTSQLLCGKVMRTIRALRPNWSLERSNDSQFASETPKD